MLGIIAELFEWLAIGIVYWQGASLIVYDLLKCRSSKDPLIAQINDDLRVLGIFPTVNIIGSELDWQRVGS